MGAVVAGISVLMLLESQRLVKIIASLVTLLFVRASSTGSSRTCASRPKIDTGGLGLTNQEQDRGGKADKDASGKGGGDGKGDPGQGKGDGKGGGNGAGPSSGGRPRRPIRWRSRSSAPPTIRPAASCTSASRCCVLRRQPPDRRSRSSLGPGRHRRLPPRRGHRGGQDPEPRLPRPGADVDVPAGGPPQPFALSGSIIAPRPNPDRGGS
ncbi:MAG: hypothetical protein R3F43_14230 [bacterium]